VGNKRFAWHIGFERNLQRRGPLSFEVRSEVQLTSEPLRPDYLLLRKIADKVLDDAARTLRRLWPALPRVSLVEYKSPSRPYRPGNLDRLWGYVHTHFANERGKPRTRAAGTKLAPGMEGAPDVWTRADLCAVLVVPGRTPSLDDDVKSMGLLWEDRGGGYWQVTGGLFVLHVVEIDVVGPAEGDDLLHSLGNGTPITPEALWFWAEFVGSKEAGMSMQDMEGYDEVVKKFLAALPPEQVLSQYPPEQRLAGLPPEQRLAGLDREHQALALPVEILRLLPDDYICSLPPDVQAEIRRRLG
jgi:hypothetical protein